MRAFVSLGGYEPQRLKVLRTYAGGNGPLMKVLSYASSAHSPPDKRTMGKTGWPHVLISYVYDRDGTFLDKLGYMPPDFLVDSGAFTQWSNEAEKIDVDEYAAYVLRYRETVPHVEAITLDVIPGTPSGKAPSTRERKRAMAESLSNGDQLRAAGLKVWEVFHLHEPLDHLDLLLDRRQEGEVVGIGGIAGGAAPSVKKAFVDSVFARIRDRFGWGNLPPLHGLGVGPDSTIGNRYPWRSIDSSTWLHGALFGYKPAKLGGRQRDDRRVTAPSVREDYLIRALEAWARNEAALSAMWTRRGIVLQP